MWSLIILTIGISSAYGQSCNACFSNVCYERINIFDVGFRFYGQIAIDYVSNNVYFHMENDKLQSYNIVMNLKEADAFSVIKDLAFQATYARAVDQRTGYLYIGAPEGIFRYDPNAKRASYYALHGKVIWHMQVNNGKIHYTLFDGVNGHVPGMHVYDNGVSYTIEALNNYTITDFIIDRNNDFYFMSMSDYNLYKLKSGETVPTLFKGDIYVMTTDINKNAYFVQPASRVLYKMNYDSGSLDELGVFPSPGKPYIVAFDRDNNIVYYDSELRRMFFLRQTGGQCDITRDIAQ